MRGSNKALNDRDMRFDQGVPALVEGVLAGRLGFSVRSRPGCRTLLVEDEHGAAFCKLREGERGAAEAEWHWLHVLPMLGLGVPQPLAFERRGRRSLVCTAPAPGRPLDALLGEALRGGRLAQAVDFACRVVAVRIRQLHDQGLVFRDLYWNHLFSTSLATDADLVFLDVERVFRPRWRRFRWVVKDLAGLLASLPVPVGSRAGMRFLRAYLGERAGERWLRKKLAKAVLRKAAAIRRHAPRYGS